MITRPPQESAKLGMNPKAGTNFRSDDTWGGTESIETSDFAYVLSAIPIVVFLPTRLTTPYSTTQVAMAFDPGALQKGLPAFSKPVATMRNPFPCAANNRRKCASGI